MILLRIDGEVVKGIELDVDPSYQPQANEIMVENMPVADLMEGEIAMMYYRNGHIEFEIIRRD